MASIVVNYSVTFGQSVRIGYRLQSTSSPFTYVPGYPSYNDAPYTISGIPEGLYEIEITTLCPNCSGGILSDPTVYPANTI